MKRRDCPKGLLCRVVGKIHVCACVSVRPFPVIWNFENNQNYRDATQFSDNNSDFVIGNEIECH